MRIQENYIDKNWSYTLISNPLFININPLQFIFQDPTLYHHYFLINHAFFKFLEEDQLKVNI